MNKKTKISDKTEKRTLNKKKLGYSVAAILAVMALIAGLSYAWFYNKTDMATLMAIKPPSTISILGPNGSEMTSLDLDYTDADKNGDTVTVRRVICVQSEVSVDAYKLEIVHTTNLRGLTFHLYPVSETENSVTGNSVTDGGTTYNYDPAKRISGNYLNLESKSASNYKYATNDKHNENYGSYSNVQAHAEPLYWLVDQPLNPVKNNPPVTIENRNYNRTYYVCEVTWTETTKETDLFYILAKTVSGTPVPDQSSSN